MTEKILKYHAQHQAQRAKCLTGKTIADRMTQLAKNRRMGYGPKIKALFIVIGDALESIIYEDSDETEETIEMIEDLDSNLFEEFHDANHSPPPSPHH